MLRAASNVYAKFKIDTQYDPLKQPNVAAFPWYTQQTAEKAAQLKSNCYWRHLFKFNNYSLDIQKIYRRFIQSISKMDRAYMEMVCEPVFQKKIFHLTREIHRDGFMFDVTEVDLNSEVKLLYASLSKGLPISREMPLPSEPKKSRLMMVGPSYEKYQGANELSDFLDVDNKHYKIQAVVSIASPMRFFLYNQNRSCVLYPNDVNTCIMQLEANVKWYEMYRLMPTPMKPSLFDAWKITDFNFLMDGNKHRNNNSCES
jgi:hypothetical protein